MHAVVDMTNVLKTIQGTTLYAEEYMRKRGVHFMSPQQRERDGWRQEDGRWTSDKLERALLKRFNAQINKLIIA